MFEAQVDAKYRHCFSPKFKYWLVMLYETSHSFLLESTSLGHFSIISSKVVVKTTDIQTIQYLHENKPVNLWP
jgi:hypothetical protein